MRRYHLLILLAALVSASGCTKPLPEKRGQRMADALWGPVTEAAWRSVPVTSGAGALERDVANGRAVFATIPTGEPYALKLPVCAWLTVETSDERVPVVVVQGETTNGGVFGFRYLEGGNGVCTLPELEFLPDPDERFWAARSRSRPD